MDSYTLIGALEEGGFGKVYKTVRDDEPNGRVYAVKRVRAPSTAKEDVDKTKRSVKREMFFLRLARSVHVVEFFGLIIGESDNRLAYCMFLFLLRVLLLTVISDFIMELAEHGDLTNYIDRFYESTGLRKLSHIFYFCALH